MVGGGRLKESNKTGSLTGSRGPETSHLLIESRRL